MWEVICPACYNVVYTTKGDMENGLIIGREMECDMCGEEFEVYEPYVTKMYEIPKSEALPQRKILSGNNDCMFQKEGGYEQREGKQDNRRQSC